MSVISIKSTCGKPLALLDSKYEQTLYISCEDEHGRTKELACEISTTATLECMQQSFQRIVDEIDELITQEMTIDREDPN
ncbi:MAG: hypothetical protein V3T59_02625 [Desulfobacterales bacterium]